MENEGAFGNWVQIPSPSSCSPFPDQFVVPPAGTTTSAAAAGPHHNHHYPQCFQHQAQGHHHLTCLKLGKRQYYAGDEPAPTVGGPAKITGRGGGGATKRERSSSACGVVPRCQVEGCNKALIDAKDYHRRHKVCEMHSKAPKVVVLGAEQRFCQQCSRFHAISEFDESKRSCRRRLAGHNERRRKSSGGGGSVSIMRGPTAAATALGVETMITGSRFSFLSQTSPGRALSLLSSKANPWIPTAELASRSSAALRELIAENRAALLARQLFTNRSWHSGVYDNIQSIISFGPHRDQGTAQGTAQVLNGWNQFQESGRGLTLDLMQSPTSASFEFLSRRSKSEEEEECCEIWKSLEGTHVT